MADFGKINPEKAQAIINALKDGRINSKEMEKLGLTAEEAKALNEAFASGAAEIGDFVLVNKGQIEKDGKKIQLSSTKAKEKPVDEKTALLNEVAEKRDSGHWYDSFKAAVKYNKQHDPTVQQASGFGKLALAALFGVATMFTATSCQKIEMDQKETQIENMERLSPYLIKIIEKLDGVRGDISDLKNDMNSGFNELSSNDKQIINRLGNILSSLDEFKNKVEVSHGEIKSLLSQVKAWLELIENNQETQIEIGIAGGKAFTDFVDNLFVILNDISLSDKEKFDKILAKMQDIENVNIDTNNTVKEISEKISGLKGQFDDSAIIAAIDNLAAKGDQANAMLELIYDAMGALGDDMKKYFGDLINAAVKNGSKIDDLKALLNAINNSVKNGTEVQKQNAEAILKKLDELGFKVVDGMDKITQAVQAGNVKLDTIIAILNDIKGLVSEYGEKGNKLGNAILAAIGKINLTTTVDLSGIEKLIKQFDANQEVRNQKVLDAIAKLGAGVAGDLSAILNAINSIPQTEQKDYSDALNAILDKIKEGNANNNANFKAVLDAIEKHGAKVTVGMNAILDAIKNQPDYSTKLDAILKKLDALGAKAQEILEAIKDHDVKITVDVTGKVQCECNCNCGDGGKHEGIIGDLNNLLG